MASLVGQDIGRRYNILEQIGQGGMATVYKAHDQRLERQVAIKFIRPSAIVSKEHAEKLLKRFEREAKALAKLSHPNIVKVYDYGEYENLPYIVMEYLPGGTLKNKIGKPMPVMEAAKLIEPVARALDYAHKHDIIHRDVKPANILMTESGEVTLTDFGIAKLLESEESTALTGTGVGIGTPEYMAPEQGAGKPIDNRADVYALGILFFELLTGRKPFQGETPVATMLKQMNDPLPDIRQYVPNISEEIVHILNKALEKDPQNRYIDMGAFAERLEKIAHPGKKSSETEETNILAEGKTVIAMYPPIPSAAYTSPRTPDFPYQSSISPSAQPSESVQPTAIRSTVENYPPSISTPTSIDKTPYATPIQPAIDQYYSPPAQTPLEVYPNVPQPRASTDGYAAYLPPTSTRSTGKSKIGLTTVIGIISIILLGGIVIVILLSIAIFSPPAPRDNNENTNLNSTPIQKGIAPPPGSTQIIPKDTSVMVYVPEGEFLMGSIVSDKDAFVDEKPQHPVYLDAFWIDRTEVTNFMFKAYVSESKYKTDAEKIGQSSLYDTAKQDWEMVQGVNWQHPSGQSSTITGYENNPVVHVSWNDAQAYCKWAGKRLPSEAEWEKAARGTDSRKFPWGNTVPEGNLLNFADKNTNLPAADKEINDGFMFTAPVGSFPDGASPFGALDMAGNVWEWVRDKYDKDYYAASPLLNPTGTQKGLTTIFRGGSWTSRARYVRITNRGYSLPNVSDDNTGFRCALTAPQIVPKDNNQSEGTAQAKAASALKYDSTAMARQTQTQTAENTCMNNVPILGNKSYITKVCDNFNANLNDWSEAQDESEWGDESYIIKNGKYQWQWTAKKGVMHRANFDMIVASDFEASLLAQRVSGKPEKACYGMVFRKLNNDYYWFSICDNQKYSVSLSEKSEWTTLLEGESKFIKAGQGNWMTIVAQTSHFDFYINKNKIGSADSKKLPVRSIGMGIELSEGEAATYIFDNFSIRVP